MMFMFVIRMFFLCRKIANVVRSVIRIFDPAKSDQRLSGDLILLQLNQSITISSKIQSIRLPEMDDNFDYQIGIASGYGATFFQGNLFVYSINKSPK